MTNFEGAYKLAKAVVNAKSLSEKTRLWTQIGEEICQAFIRLYESYINKEKI